MKIKRIIRYFMAKNQMKINTIIQKYYAKQLDENKANNMKILQQQIG